MFRCSRLSNLNVHRKSHSKAKITKPMLINMVMNGEHPFYTREDIPMIESSAADKSQTLNFVSCYENLVILIDIII